MMGRSLRWRFLLTSAVAILGVLGASAVGLSLLFERHVERVAVAELRARARSLVAMVEPRDGAEPAFQYATVGPLYELPFSGQYWQIELLGEVYRSRSLWDYSLPGTGEEFEPGGFRVMTLAGPQDEPLLVVAFDLFVGYGADAAPMRVLVASDRGELDAAKRGFIGDLMPYLVLLGVLLLLSSWAQVSIGLRPLASIRDRVAALTSGTRKHRIGTGLPTEVGPLAQEIDLLLDAREAELTRARHRAADLAHGLKTPLQALLGDAAELRDRGQAGIADSIETVARAMRRLVDRELTRARIQSDLGDARAEPGVVVRQVVEVLRRTPIGAELDWRVEAAPGVVARIDQDDLTEAVGAVLENATRFAVNLVRVDVRSEGDFAVIVVRDDGPGVAEEDPSVLIRRGVRMDEGGDRQGIGLAIVADIVEAAQGELHLRNADPGFEVTIRLKRIAGPEGAAD
ncbi:sensor histidine kinase [Amaricoccus tamworthensis]|uniref:sensor histidine kinase n=1 Tax=Amaricoccus tamworthensis TaxID=57002 RepID=UPI003C7BE6D3